jgi:tetratricopeptide (TPR) repeat protein
MEQGDNSLVEQTLTNPVYGPWTIAAGGDKSLVDQAVLEEILRLSLRFFIQTEKLEEAQKAMDLLEAAAGEGEDASERLAAMYLAMGKELQDQLGGIVGGGSGEVDAEARERAAKVVAGFEKFLERVGERDKKTSSQTWVATQFLALGAAPGQSGGGGIGQVVPKEKRQEFLAKSAAVFEALLKSGDEKVKQREKSTRLQLATVYRELGRWEDALGHLEWIVSDPQRVNWLPAQIEAATFLEAAGAAGAGPNGGGDYLRQAVVGRQDGPIVFWGWGGLGNKLAKQAFSSASKDDAKATETKRLFFEARLNVPRCRMKRADKEDDKRKEHLEMAEKDIVLTHKLYPDLGGKEFRTRFDKMLEQIQKELGRPSARGLEDLEAEDKG